MLEALLSETKFSLVVKATIKDFVWIDLSQNNPILAQIDTGNSKVFSEFINQYLSDNNAKVAVGGYNEPRNIYKRSENFNSKELEERFVHLGIDLWAKAETPVYAPLNGKIHSFKNNLGEGNYGPTIILEHKLQDHIFYTLYGHLTVESLKGLQVGTVINSGEAFAEIGNYPENGDYPPHLHFQVIQDMKGLVGDFPGVTSLVDRIADLKNCVDPNFILGL